MAYDLLHNRKAANAFFRLGVLLWLSIFTLALSASPASAEPLPERHENSPDLLVVLKSERLLYLYKNGLPVRRYPIQLGLSPTGDKLQEGDKKTPEGSYTIDWRNPESRFYRSLHISYPNAQDIRQAEAAGVDPGGLIMIHGQPGYSDRKRVGDWTDGCIAVSNQAMDELWDLVGADTRIHIYP